MPISTKVPSPSGRAPSDPPELPGRLVRAEGRSQDVVAFEETVVGFFLDAASVLGLPKSLAAIYAICFASAEPLSFSGVRGRLNISAGSISQGLRVLRQVGALKLAPSGRKIGRLDCGQWRTTAPDSIGRLLVRSRERYEPDLELRKVVGAWLEQRLQKQLDSGRRRLRDILDSLPPQYNNPSAVIRERLEHLQNWHEKADALVPFLRVFLKLK